MLRSAKLTSRIALVYYGGVGTHFAVIALKDPSELISYTKIVIAYSTFYGIAMTLPKISVLCMFLQIFVESWQRKACYVLIGILAATSVADVIANWNLCTPLSFLWDKTIPGGHCIDVSAYWRWGTFPNIVTDVLMILLPIPAIIKIQLKWKDKIGILLTFLIGGVGLVASILRFHIFYTISSIGDADPTYDLTLGPIYASLEVMVYNVCACLPFYRAFYLYVRRTGNTTKTPNSYEPKPSTWHKRTTGAASQSEGFRIPLHQGLGDQTHSTFAHSDDISEKSTDVGGIHVRSEFQVTRMNR